MSSNTESLLPGVKDLENRWNGMRARLVEQGVTGRHWYKAIDKKLNEVKELQIKIEIVEIKARFYDTWKRDMEKIGEIPNAEADPYIDVLNETAITIGTFKAGTESVKQLEGNLQTLRRTMDGCLATFEKKRQLAQEVVDGVRKRRSDGIDDAKLKIEPTFKLKGYKGDTTYGTLMRMIEDKEKNRFVQQADEGDADEEQCGDDGIYVDRELGKDDGGDVDGDVDRDIDGDVDGDADGDVNGDGGEDNGEESIWNRT